MRSTVLTLAAAAAATCFGLTAAPAADAAVAFDPWEDFTPIAGSSYDLLTADWSVPFVVPAGFRQKLVTDENTLDIYPAPTDDLSDMNTVNQTGLRRGRYLYTTKEVGSNGAVSITDLRTGVARVLVQDPGYRRLDGIRWTPWGTLLFAEEAGASGRVFEVFFKNGDPTVVDRVETRPQLGLMSHEGIGVDRAGNVYVINELNSGSIYRFVPTVRGDLSSGQLYALKITGLADADQLWNIATFSAKVGAYTWVPLDMATVVTNADAAANAVSATEFGRPEDVEVIGNTLYVANTTEDRVIAITLGARPRVRSYVQAGVNVPVEDAANKVTGFDSPDNLATSPEGELVIVEDNVPSDIWFTDGHGEDAPATVKLFASMVDPGAEGTGIYFSPFDEDTLYVNVQHPDKPQADGTWAIIAPQLRD